MDSGKDQNQIQTVELKFLRYVLGYYFLDKREMKILEKNWFLI